MGAKVLVGTSGFVYDHWRHRFYPDKLSKAKWLEFYATHFSTVELNNTFYRLPSETVFANWHDSSWLPATSAVGECTLHNYYDFSTGERREG